MSFWFEFVNVIINVVFLIVVFYMWCRLCGLLMVQVFCVVLFVIGVGSFFFYIYVIIWVVIVDVVLIVIYVLFYIFFVICDFWG